MKRSRLIRYKYTHSHSHTLPCTYKVLAFDATESTYILWLRFKQALTSQYSFAFYLCTFLICVSVCVCSIPSLSIQRLYTERQAGCVGIFIFPSRPQKHSLLKIQRLCQELIGIATHFFFSRLCVCVCFFVYFFFLSLFDCSTLLQCEK